MSWIPFSKSKKYCSVPQCRNYKSDEITIHLFPKDPDLCRQWQAALKIYKPISKYMSVCSAHFVKNDFHPNTNLKTKKFLKRNVIPTQNLPVGMYILQKMKRGQTTNNPIVATRDRPKSLLTEIHATEIISIPEVPQDINMLSPTYNDGECDPLENIFEEKCIQNKKIMKERRRTIFYLVLNFLKEESLFDTADCFLTEARLDDSHQICDNIDLDIILQEYCSYYQLKFNKQPCILKKIDYGGDRVSGATSRAKSGAHHRYKPRKSKIPHPEHLTPPVKKELSPFTVTQITPHQQYVKEEDESSDTEHPFMLKPLSGFSHSVDSEQKEIVERIAREIIYHNSEIRWSHVLGLQEAKTLLIEAVVYPRKYPELFSGMAPWKGILLHGPPGTGKTMLAKAVASESKSTFFNISPTTILSKWRGDSERNVKTLFALARYYAPSIIFIDELEAIASNRDNPNEHEASRRLKSQLLIELDGLIQNDDILLLATSNLPWEIDPAVLRRLEKRIYIPLPCEDVRLALFRKYMYKEGLDTADVNYMDAARRTDGYSGSDIRVVCKEVMMVSVRRAIDALGALSAKPKKKIHKVKQEDIEQAIAKTKPSVNNLTEKYRVWDQKLGAK